MGCLPPNPQQTDSQHLGSGLWRGGQTVPEDQRRIAGSKDIQGVAVARYAYVQSYTHTYIYTYVCSYSSILQRYIYIYINTPIYIILFQVKNQIMYIIYRDMKIYINMLNYMKIKQINKHTILIHIICFNKTIFNTLNTILYYIVLY